MNHLLSIIFFAFAISSNHVFANEAVTDNKIAEISERLESLSPDALILIN